MKPTLLPTATNAASDDTAVTNWFATLGLFTPDAGTQLGSDVDLMAGQPGTLVADQSPTVMDDTVMGVAPARVPSHPVFNTPGFYRPSDSDVGDEARPGSIGRRFVPVKINFDDVDTDGPDGLEAASGVGTGGADVETQVANLFLKMFSSDELRRLLRSYGGDQLVGALPGQNSSPAALANKAATELENRGLINKDLFDRLITERPGRRADIESVMNAIGRNTSAVSAPAPAPLPQSPIEKVAALFQSMYSPDGFARMIGYLSDCGTEMKGKLPNAGYGCGADVFACGVTVLQQYGMLGQALDRMANDRPSRAHEVLAVRSLAAQAGLLSTVVPAARVAFALPPGAAERTIRTTGGQFIIGGVGVQFENFFKLMTSLFDGESFRRFVRNQVSDRIAALLPDNTAPEEEIIYAGVVAMFDSAEGRYLEKALYELLREPQYNRRHGDIEAVIYSSRKSPVASASRIAPLTLSEEDLAFELARISNPFGDPNKAMQMLFNADDVDSRIVAEIRNQMPEHGNPFQLATAFCSLALRYHVLDKVLKRAYAEYKTDTLFRLMVGRGWIANPSHGTAPLASFTILSELGLRQDRGRLTRSTEFLHSTKLFDHLRNITGLNEAGLRRIAATLQLDKSIVGVGASLAHLIQDLIADVERNGLMGEFLIALHQAYPHDQKLAALIAEFSPGNLRAAAAGSASSDSQDSEQSHPQPDPVQPLPSLKALQPSDVTPDYEAVLAYFGLGYDRKRGQLSIVGWNQLNVLAMELLQGDEAKLRRIAAQIGLDAEINGMTASLSDLWHSLVEAVQRHGLIPHLIVSLRKECDDLTLELLAAPFLR